MKFSENWLREWVNPPVDTDTLCEQLTMAGLEVDSLKPAAPALDGVVVGRIVAAEKHPDADSLQLCAVDVGAKEPLSIVCGAPNARVDLMVAVAQVGVTLPGGMQIKPAEIRGVASQGMLCSASELGLSDESAGLLVLDLDGVPGTALTQHLQLQDQVIEIDLTPNRGDCLSLRGVAREVGVANRLKVSQPPLMPVDAAHDNEQVVRIEAQAACSSYAGRIISGLDSRARTPDWLRERLRRAGLRPISPVVDITNYVMLELGQPMHAFDHTSLQGAVTVRYARDGETITLLDGADVRLQSDTLVIAHETGPIALAGIMGGAETAVQAESTSVFLESACFTPAVVAGMGRRYKRHTDALHRYERGVDPGLQRLAIERATALIVQICNGKPGPVTLEGESTLAAGEAIELRHARVERLLGSAIPADEITEILERLEMQVETQAGGWKVTPPSFRFDIALEADLIEEVARVHGYNRLPARSQHVPAPITPQPEQDVELQRLREVLLQRGYSEAITYSFVDAALQQRIMPQTTAVDVDNPIAEQYAQMRTSLWSGLLPVWEYNARRQGQRIRLFEFGLRFSRDTQAPLGIAQQMTCAGVISGSAAPEHWDTPKRNVDLFDLKGDIQALFAVSRGEVEFQPSKHPALHPGRSASILFDSVIVGHLGQLHPEHRKQYGNKELPYLFEVDCKNLLLAPVPRYEKVADFPWVRRDIAVVVAEEVTAGELKAALRENKSEFLAAVDIFDLFRGKDLEIGFKSIALSLIFQDKSSTLTDEGVDDAVAKLTAHLEERYGAQVRGRKSSGTYKG